MKRGRRCALAAALLGLAAVAGPPAMAVDPDALLDPEKAFRISARALDERNAEVEFKIAEGYYMYRNRFSFATGSGKPLADVEIPRGKEKEDEFFGKTETFRDLVRIRVPLAPEDTKAGGVNLKVTSQGCADVGVCYTPLEQTVRVNFPGPGPGAQRQLPSSLTMPSVPWGLLAASLAAALTLGWAAAGAPLRRRESPRIAARPSAGSIGLAIALAAAAALLAWLGSRIGARAENPWLAGPIALGYVVCAAFCLIWSQRSGERGPVGWQWPNIALLAAAMLFAFHIADAWVGGAAALGAGLACALAPRERHGPVSELALQGVALAMLAAAAWVAGPILPDLFRMLAWSAWLFIAAALLRATDPLPQSAPGAMRVAKAAGVAALVWAIAVLIGAASGARDPLQPFAAWRTDPEAGLTRSVR